MSREDTARVNGDMIMTTARLLKSGTFGVKESKEYLKMIMQPTEKDGALIYPWQFFRLVDTSGVTILDATRDPPKTFREFVESPPLRGLGEKLSDIERLIADDAESLVRLRELIVAGKGNPTGNNQVGNNNNVIISSDLFTDPEPATKKSTQGNSRAYTLTRLKNERPDLFERVVAKELTANRAAIEAGWRKRPDAVAVAKRVVAGMTTDQLREFGEWWQGGAK